MSEASKQSTTTSRELHLLAALKTIRAIAAHNAERHTGFVHIGRIAAAWLDTDDPSPQSNQDLAEVAGNAGSECPRGEPGERLRGGAISAKTSNRESEQDA